MWQRVKVLRGPLKDHPNIWIKTERPVMREALNVWSQQLDFAALRYQIAVKNPNYSGDDDICAEYCLILAETCELLPEFAATVEVWEYEDFVAANQDRYEYYVRQVNA